MTYRLIIINDVTIFRKPVYPDTAPLKNYVKHIVTRLSIAEFIIRYNDRIKATNAKFQDVGMDGWFEIVNVVELGELTIDQLSTFDNGLKHISLTVWNGEIEE